MRQSEVKESFVSGYMFTRESLLNKLRALSQHCKGMASVRAAADLLDGDSRRPPAPIALVVRRGDATGVCHFYYLLCFACNCM